MVDYEYKPINDNTEYEESTLKTISNENKKILDNQEISGYTKVASTSLIELDEIEPIEDTSPVYSDEKFYNEPVKKVISVSSDNIPYSDVNKSERLKQLESKANLDINGSPFENRGLYTTLSKVYMEIIDELLFVNNFDDIIKIFSKEDRLFSIIILICLICVFILFFNKVIL
jgi:hypothetical protein